jgi:hypothetical protein
VDSIDKQLAEEKEVTRVCEARLILASIFYSWRNDGGTLFTSTSQVKI